MTKRWYANTKGNQGLVCEEKTGKSIAVSYETNDATLIAAAPELLNELQNVLTLLEYMRSGEKIVPAVLVNQIHACISAISNAGGFES